jgi:small subunit ribosomal protein S6
MTREPATYDLVLMLDAEAPEETRTRIVDEVGRLIEQGGSIVGRHDWGVRRMAYEIDHRDGSDYRLFQLHASPELLETLNRTLRITDGVIRYRIVKLAPGTPPPPEPRAPEARAAEREAPEHGVAEAEAAGHGAPEGEAAETPETPPEPAPAP